MLKRILNYSFPSKRYASQVISHRCGSRFISAIRGKHASSPLPKRDSKPPKRFRQSNHDPKSHAQTNTQLKEPNADRFAVAVKTYLAQSKPVGAQFAAEVIQSTRITPATPEQQRQAAATIMEQIAQDLITQQCKYHERTVANLVLNLRSFGKYELITELWESIVNSGVEDIMELFYPVLCALTDSMAHTPHSMLEDIYQQALSHSLAGSFAEYQAQPNVVFAHKQNATSGASGVHPQIPLIIAAIARARLKNAHSLGPTVTGKSGYLALDSALKFNPTIPKFLSENLLSHDHGLPASQAFRIAQASCLDGHKLYHYKIRLVMHYLRLSSQNSHKRLHTDTELAEAMKPLLASLNLLTAHLDVGGNADLEFINKIVLMVTSIVHPDAVKYLPQDQAWIKYAHSLSQCTADFVELLMPYIKVENSRIPWPYQLVVNLAVQARNKELFHSTMSKHFDYAKSKGEDTNKAALIAAPLLVKGAGVFGSPEDNTIVEAWNEVTKHRHPDEHDLLALAQAVRAQPTDANQEFLATQIPRGHRQMKYFFKIVAEALHPPPPRTQFLNLDKAQSMVLDMFALATERVKRLEPKLRGEMDPSVLVLPNAEKDIDTRPWARSESLRCQPLATDETMYQVYQELTRDPETESDPTSLYPFGRFKQQQDSIAWKRFCKWVTVTELLADTHEREKYKNRNSIAHTENEMDNPTLLIQSLRFLEGDDKEALGSPLDALFTQPPRFVRYAKVYKYVKLVRGIE